MRIVPYDLKYKNDFIEMNKAWISEMFEMEPEDERELGSKKMEVFDIANFL